LKLSYHSCLPVIFFIVLLFVLYCSSSNAHHNEWTGVKIYPSIALANGLDLYQTKSGPYLLTQYGPGSPIFYLPSSLGSSPQSVINIATFICYTVIILIGWFLFGRSLSGITLVISLCLGFAWIFILFLDKSTHTFFQIHHDLPLLAYFAVASFLLLSTGNSYNLAKVCLAFLFLWMAFWTKIVALPWLVLPFFIKIFSTNHSISLFSVSWCKLIYAFFGSGCLLFLFFGLLFGFEDIFFHLFQSTNSYSFRECLSLWGGPNEHLISNDFPSKIEALFRLSIHYANEYWILLMGNCFILLHQLRFKDCILLTWLSMSYFLILPFCLAALAKFGGVENSLAFAHAPAYAAILLQGTRILDAINFSEWAKVSIAFLITIAPALGSFRTAKAILKDPSQSPLQTAYEYLLKNPAKPVYFALAPLPNYLATGKIWDSGEALTYSTMMTEDSLPPNAGTQGPLEMTFIAFGNPPYSKSFFSKKFDLVIDDETPTLSGWSIYRAIPKAYLQVK
jgi:hypothetical protein